MKNNPNSLFLQQAIRKELFRLGFSVVRFTEPPLGLALQHFKDWLAKGYGAEMAYLTRRQTERVDPQTLLPTLRSILVLAHPYDTLLENTDDPAYGNVSRYAWGEDYHNVLSEKLQSFQRWLQEQVSDCHCYVSVDAQPVLEKAWAQKSGLGWMGKHTNIIHPDQGSYFFISTVLTDLAFEPDPQTIDHCGTCTSCIEACPTGAIVAPYVLDAGLCISYLTIELKGAIPRRLRPLIGNRIFGCDDCQEVCPWNRFSQVTPEKRFFPQEGIRNQPLSAWVQLDRQQFKKRFQNSPVSRPKWKGFLRNVLVAIGNSGDPSLAPLVQEKLADEEPLVRGHAVWAYAQLLEQKAIPVLEKIQASETDTFVLEEIGAALSSVMDL